MRDASRALLPLFVFSCHALAAQQWISMRDTAGWIHKYADISPILPSHETKRPIDASSAIRLPYLVAPKGERSYGLPAAIAE